MTRLAGNTRRIAARSTTTSLALALVLVGIVPSSAQMLYAPESLQRDFRVEWQPTQNRRGAGIEGYVYNTSNRTAQRVSLRIERVELPIDGSRVLQRVRPHRGQLPCPGSLVRLVVSGRWRRRDVAERRPIRLNATTSSR